VTKLVHIKIKTNYKQFTDLVAEKLHLWYENYNCHNCNFKHIPKQNCKID
jgi:hypothetical protein